MAKVARRPRSPSGRGTPETLSPTQLGLVMLSQGFPPDPGRIATGIGVSTAESGRRRTAVNVNSDGGSRDRGPWQINDRWHPEVSDACAFDWVCSTRHAREISNDGADWSQWTTFSAAVGVPYQVAARRAIRQAQSGGAQFASLKDFLGPMGPVPDALGFGGGPDVIPDLPSPGEIGGALAGPLGDIATVLEGIAKFFVGLGELLLTPEGWLRLGKILFGSIALVWGLNILVRETTGSNPIGTALGTAKTAAVVAAVK